MRKHGIFRKNLSLHIQKKRELIFLIFQEIFKNGLTY